MLKNITITFFVFKTTLFKCKIIPDRIYISGKTFFKIPVLDNNHFFSLFTDHILHISNAFNFIKI